MKKKRLALLLSTIMGVAVMTGFGNASVMASSVTSTSSEVASTASAGSATEGTSSSDTITFGIQGDIDNFDPLTNQQIVFVRTINFNVYECLFHYNDKMEYEWDLATDYEQPDDTTYIFHLREGVTFHNGEPFTADDVVYTIQQIQDENTGAWRASQYAAVKDVKAVDDNTVEFDLSNPQPSFMDNLAYTAIISKSTTQKELQTTPVGTGAYKFVSWTPNDSIVLKKNPDYWDVDRVSIDNVILKVIPDSTVALTNLESGTIQLLNGIDSETANAVQNIQGLTLYQSKSANTLYEVEIGRNNNEALADPDVEKALFLALDRDTIAQSVWGGMANAAKSPFPSSAKYYEEVDNDGYDLEEAKKILSTTDYADGFEFEVKVLTDDLASQQAMVIWQSALSQLGITMDIKVSEMSVWLDSYLNRDYDMICNYYSMVGTDPATYCNVILTGLADYQMNDLTDINDAIAEASSTTDDAIREKDYKAIQEGVVKYRPVTSYIECPTLSAATDNLSGVQINNMGHTILKYAKFN